MEPDTDQLEAGIDKFGIYGDINTLESLSGGDVTKWESIKAIDRATIFIKRRIDKDKTLYERALREIAVRNSKIKK